MTKQGLFYEKLFLEYNGFLDELRDKPPQEIIEAAMEKVVKEEILDAFGDKSFLTDHTAQVLLDRNVGLNDFYEFWQANRGYAADLGKAVYESLSDQTYHIEREHNLAPGYSTALKATESVYKAEISVPDEADPIMEVFDAENDEEAIKYANEILREKIAEYGGMESVQGMEDNGVWLDSLHELDSDYNIIRDIDLSYDNDNTRLFVVLGNENTVSVTTAAYSPVAHFEIGDKDIKSFDDIPDNIRADFEKFIGGFDKQNIECAEDTSNQIMVIGYDRSTAEESAKWLAEKHGAERVASILAGNLAADNGHKHWPESMKEWIAGNDNTVNPVYIAEYASYHDNIANDIMDLANEVQKIREREAAISITSEADIMTSTPYADKVIEGIIDDIKAQGATDIIEFLRHEKGIDTGIISRLMDEGTLWEAYNNNEPISLTGTEKRMASVYVFDSNIALLSHATVAKINGWESPDKDNVPHRLTLLKSLDKPIREQLSEFLRNTPGIVSILPCFEKSGGADMARSLKFHFGQAYDVHGNRPPFTGESWNDTLLNCNEYGLKQFSSQAEEPEGHDMDFGDE